MKEKNLSIQKGNHTKLEVNQVIAVVSSFNGLRGFSSLKEYAFQLADTVVVVSTSDSGVPSVIPEINPRLVKYYNPKGHWVLTGSQTNQYNDVGYFLEKDEPQKRETTNAVRDTKKTPKFDNKKKIWAEDLETGLSEEVPNWFDFKPTHTRKTRLALQKKKLIAEKESMMKMRKHQKELLDLKMREITERYQSGRFVVKETKVAKIRLDRLEVYNGDTFPKHLQKDKIRIDSKRFALLLPIMGRIVPFHVCVLKNVISQKEENGFSTLRFNFYTPGIGINNLVFPTLETFTKDISLLQEVVYMSKLHEQFNSIAKQVKDLQKKYKLNEEILEVGTKERFTLIKELARLSDIKMRPSLTGRKTVGELTAFSNGFRFVSLKKEEFELSNKWVKHAIFQPCDENMMIMLHLRLNRYILVNKKKSRDVQFFCEVGLVAEDLSDPKKRRARPEFEDIEEEELESAARQKFNELFLQFIDKVNKGTGNHIKFDSPYTDYGFHGSPFYNNVFIMPCAYCLMSITEKPFFVLTLDEVEIVSLERVDNRIKNFDMVFIFKNYTRPVRTVSNIPKSNLEKIKCWLDSNNILFFEGGSLNLNWGNILRKIRLNPGGFIYREGGWRSFFDDMNDFSSVEEIGKEEGSEFDENEISEFEESDGEEGFMSDDEQPDYFEVNKDQDVSGKSDTESEEEYDFDNDSFEEEPRLKRDILD